MCSATRPSSPHDARAIGVATVFQEVLVADESSILDNLYLGADRLWSRTQTRAAKTKAAETLMTELTGLDLDLDMPVGALPLSLKAVDHHRSRAADQAENPDPRRILRRARSRFDRAPVRENPRAARRGLVRADRDASHRRNDPHRRSRDGAARRPRRRRARQGRHHRSQSAAADGRQIRASRRRRARLSRTRAISDVVMKADALKIWPRQPRDRLSPASRRDPRRRRARRATGSPSSFACSPACSARKARGRSSSARAAAFTPSTLLPTPRGSKVFYVSGDRKREGIFANLSIFENMLAPLYRSKSRGGKARVHRLDGALRLVRMGAGKTLDPHGRLAATRSLR